MAQRRVSVVLDAAVGQFQKGMQQAQRQTQQFGQSLQQNAASLTRLGLGMTATAGVLAMGMRSAGRETAEFESTLMRMRTQIGLTEQEARDMGEAALALRHTGRGPQELGDALWFAGSAGLRGEEAMDAVESSAKAAAIGLGDTAGVVDLVTSAMNAYGSETLDAEEATDILVGTVRQGKAEAPALAAALGQILPIASEMGVQFEDVGAAVASMTRTGTDAGTAAMQLRQILASLLNPAQGVEDAMTDLGISSEQVRATIRDDGLWAALMDLRDATGDNEQALGQLFPNIRALAGFLDLTGSNAEENAQIFEEMADTTGLLSDGFEMWGTTTEAAQQKFSAALEAAKITAGEDFQPAMRTLLDTGTALAEKFIELDPAVRKFGSQAAMASTAVLGLSGSALTTAGSTALLVSSLSNLGVTMGAVAAVGGPIAGAVAAVGGVAFITAKTMNDARIETDRLVDEIVRASDSIPEATGRIEDHIDDLRSSFFSLGESTKRTLLGSLQGPLGVVGDLISAMDWADFLESTGRARDRIDELSVSMSDAAEDGLLPMQTGSEVLAETSDELAREILQAAEAGGITGDALDDLAGSLGVTADEADELVSALARVASELREGVDPVMGFVRAQESYQEALEALTDAQSEHEEGSQELIDAERDVMDAFLSVMDASGELQGALEDGTISAEDMARQLREMGVPQNVIDRWLSDFDSASDAVWELNRSVRMTRDEAKKAIQARIRVLGDSEAHRTMQQLLGELNAINRTWRANIEVTGGRVPAGVEIRHGGGRVGMDPTPTTSLFDPMSANERLVLAEVGERVVTEQQWHAMQAPTVQVMHGGGTVGGGQSAPSGNVTLQLQFDGQTFGEVVVSSARLWQRHNGPIPIRVA